MKQKGWENMASEGVRPDRETLDLLTEAATMTDRIASVIEAVAEGLLDPRYVKWEDVSRELFGLSHRLALRSEGQGSGAGKDEER